MEQKFVPKLLIFIRSHALIHIHYTCAIIIKLFRWNTAVEGGQSTNVAVLHWEERYFQLLLFCHKFKDTKKNNYFILNHIILAEGIFFHGICYYMYLLEHVVHERSYPGNSKYIQIWRSGEFISYILYLINQKLSVDQVVYFTWFEGPGKGIFTQNFHQNWTMYGAVITQELRLKKQLHEVQ